MLAAQLPDRPGDGTGGDRPPGGDEVGDLLDDTVGPGGEPLAAGTRVVLDPLLGCVPRGLAPCPGCAEGRADRCDGLPLGHLAPGLQTGFCADTGGGWSEQLLAHGSQLRAIPQVQMPVIRPADGEERRQAVLPRSRFPAP